MSVRGADQTHILRRGQVPTKPCGGTSGGALPGSPARANPPTAPGSGRGGKRLRAALFFLGDCAFLVFVGAASALATHLFHQTGLNYFLASLAGMSAAMLVQTAAAFGVAPVLGSIESGVPSMPVAMAGPMALCALGLAGGHPDLWRATALGAATGAVVFLLVRAYGLKCRRALRRSSTGGRGHI